MALCFLCSEPGKYRENVVETYQCGAMDFLIPHTLHPVHKEGLRAAATGEVSLFFAMDAFVVIDHLPHPIIGSQVTIFILVTLNACSY